MVLAAVYSRQGDPVDEVRLVEIDESTEPAPGKVVIRVTLFPVH
jgi:hypothetical protein